MKKYFLAALLCLPMLMNAMDDQESIIAPDSYRSPAASGYLPEDFDPRFMDQRPFTPIPGSPPFEIGQGDDTELASQSSRTDSITTEATEELANLHMSSSSPQNNNERN